MKLRWFLVLTVIAAVPLSGCEYGRRFVRKPWGKGTYIPAAVCAALGAGAGVGVQEARRGTSEASVGNTKKSQKDNPDYWEGALVGAAIGAAACGLAGHYLFDKEEEAAAQPPPPPPPPPPVPLLPPPTSRRIVLRGVNFDFGQTAIRADSRPILDEAAAVLQQNPNVRVSVEGHTDSIGADEYNEKLSVRRAEAVFRYLVNRGVAPSRMGVIGYGRSRPVADNTTESGRAENRRVELHILAPVTQPNAP
jgi:outer membrane protein OmpA-like peptidoglycan-associated protein